MVKITLELIRKRSEHNEGEISTLEEISLHQEYIEKIELLSETCRNLKILLMQNNVIGKIENLNMLKRLEYLNLALNNIEVIENLEGLESLQKLDLTINFIGDLKSVKRLRFNENLRILYLTGNPCSEFFGYREYVVASLQQLDELDSKKIERSERILAIQNFCSTEDEIIRESKKYSEKRWAQKIHNEEEKTFDSTNGADETEISDDEASKFWNKKGLDTPEERIAIAKMCEKREEKRSTRTEKKTEEKIAPRLTSPGGTPYNMNQPKIPFTLDDETDRDNLVLVVSVYKHLDSSYLDVEVNPRHIKIMIKGKILQLRLPCEVSVEGSEAKRNVTTGNLVVTMPRLDPLPFVLRKSNEIPKKIVTREPALSRRQFLEIGPDESYRNFKTSKKPVNLNPAEPFIDDPEVPPLE